jgi:3D (Asp-Asp-Asp) domain-containing protein
MFLLGLTLAQARPATVTSYTGDENPEYRRHGRYLNAQGLELDETQCAASSCYAFGTVVRFTTSTGITIDRTVSDRGSAITGRNHFDLYWRDRRRMQAFGTQICEIEILSILPKPLTLKHSLRKNPSANWRMTRKTTKGNR